MALSLRDSKLRPLGTLARANQIGELPRLGSPPAGRMGHLVTEFAKALYSQVGDTELSIVLRGSLARGGQSPADIDLMLISHKRPDLPPLRTLPELPLEAELGLVPLESFNDPKHGAWPRFALAHSGCTIMGPDYISDLPEPKMGSVVIAHLRGLRRWWPLYPLDWASSEAERRQINGWLAKRIIRSLAEGEMLRRGVYSRDVWPCLQIACLAFPQHTSLLTDIAEQAVFPSGSIGKRSRLLEARSLLEHAYVQHLRRPIRLPS